MVAAAATDIAGAGVSAVLLAIWHFSTVGRTDSLIPPPYDVWLELRDLAFGGINDDAYSGTLYVHLLASVSGSMAVLRWRSLSRCRWGC